MLLEGLQTIHRELTSIEASEFQPTDLEEDAILGEGETFTVHRCKLGSQLVAVKHLKVQSLAENVSKFSHRLRAILMELRIMCCEHLRGHPNIISLLGYGWRYEQQTILPYIVVDHSPHGTLRDYLKSGTPLKSFMKKSLIQDVARGLDALHMSGIVHGDLKLDNVLVFDRCNDSSSGRIAKICDFGHSILLLGDAEELVYRGTTM